jgi:hypothetical protein
MVDVVVRHACDRDIGLAAGPGEWESALAKLLILEITLGATDPLDLAEAILDPARVIRVLMVHYLSPLETENLLDLGHGAAPHVLLEATLCRLAVVF